MLGPDRSTKHNGRQHPLPGDSTASGTALILHQGEDHSFQTILLTLRLVPLLPFIMLSGCRLCVPNDILEKALLPGWAPDAALSWVL